MLSSGGEGRKSIILTGRIVGEEDLFYLKFWAKLALLLQKRRLLIYIRSQRLSHNT